MNNCNVDGRWAEMSHILEHFQSQRVNWCRIKSGANHCQHDHQPHFNIFLALNWFYYYYYCYEVLTFKVAAASCASAFYTICFHWMEWALLFILQWNGMLWKGANPLFQISCLSSIRREVWNKSVRFSFDTSQAGCYISAMLTAYNFPVRTNTNPNWC